MINKKRVSNKQSCYHPIVVLVVTLLLVSGFFISSQAVRAQVEIGGEVKTSLVTAIYDGKITWNLQEQLDLKLLLPRMGQTDAAVELAIYNPPLIGLEGKTHFNFKKLYLRHRFKNYNLTVGRQPISWSFGSMLNPVDYTLGAVAMDQETGGKYQEAVEVYLPVNWNTGLAFITSQENYSEELKWGVRGRTEFKGYDLTASFVREPGQIAIPAIQRAGVTAKGDLGPFGIYGAVGYYRTDGNGDDNYSYLFGGDYNYIFGYDRQLLFQLEYLKLNESTLKDIIGSSYGIEEQAGNEFNLLLGNINYPIDDFSSIGLMTLSSLDDGSILLIPTYQNQMGSNLNLTLRGMVLNGPKEKLFGIKEFPGQGVMRGNIEVSLGYPF